VSLLKMNGRGLKFKSRRAVGRRRHSQDWHVVVWGLVETGSEWDGLHICIVWQQIRQNCASDEAATDLTRAVWENRVQTLRELRRNGRGVLDEALASIQTEEPWALEPEPSYFEDEVNYGL
jgi:hypothetical protein